MSSNLLRFEEVIKALRDPKTGCPWDLAQSHASLKKYFLEEVYEFLSEVDAQNPTGMEEELGDVLLQVYLHATMLEESSFGQISLDTIASKICDKIIRRHPHVFDPDFDSQGKSVEEHWQRIKQEERQKKQSEGKGSGQSSTNPFDLHRNQIGLQRLEKIYRDIKNMGFRFPDARVALEKVAEEVQEVRELDDESLSDPLLKEELGDLMLSVCSCVIEYGFSPEELLQSGFQKFQSRWEDYFARVQENELDLNELSYEEKQNLWQKVKRERANSRRDSTVD